MTSFGTAPAAALMPSASPVNKPTTDELEKAIQPIRSSISKSEKAQQKLSTGTWQHKMLQENLRALRIALELMEREPGDASAFAPEDLRAALLAFAAMTDRSEKAQAKFAPGSSQHTLQQNRLGAFQTAEALIKAELE